MNTPRPASDAQLIERLEAARKTLVSLSYDGKAAGVAYAIARLRELTQRPAEKQEISWNTSVPSVEEGGEKSFLVAFKSKHASGTKVFVKQLDYRNRWVGPESDHCSAECKEQPAGEDGDYYWTGWFESSCESCDTYWRFSNEVIGWIELPAPPAPAVLTPEEKQEQAFEDMLEECIPGGSVCDPQEIADKLRNYRKRQSLREGGV